MALRLYWGWSLLWLTCVHVRVCVCVYVFMPIYLTENESVSYLVMSNSATA